MPTAQIHLSVGVIEPYERIAATVSDGDMERLDTVKQDATHTVLVAIANGTADNPAAMADRLLLFRESYPRHWAD